MTELLQKSLKALLSVSVVLVLLWLRPSMAAKPDGVPVGVILDLNSELGKMVNNSLALAVEDKEYYTATKIRLIVRNVSQNDAVAAAGNGDRNWRQPLNMQAASELIEKHKVRAILGPQNSEQAGFIVELGLESQVPVIWFPITGPSLLPPPSPSSNQGLNCFQFQAIAATIEALGWQSIVPIFEDTEYGGHLIPCLSNVLKDTGIRMVNITAIDPDSTDGEIDDILVKLNNRRTHVFLVHMSMDLGIRFIQSAEEQDMMGEGYAWILTQGLSSLTDPQVTTGNPLKGYMQGALGVRPMDSNKTRWRRWKESYFVYRFNRTLTVYGWWAYHTIEALAMAVEKAGADNGAKLRDEILAANVSSSESSGLNFSLSKGQLDQSVVLEVYNVIGARERVIGYWSPETGLVQNFSKGAKISGKYQLKDPLWPGDTLDKPPKLRIGVVTTNSFPESVNVDNSTTPVMINGFAFHVFLKVVDVLPFPLDYEFVPLPNKSRSGTPMYDDILCNQMKDRDLDAIIGDITVVAHRTNCVDFTLPYLDSSVTMMVRVENASISKGILLKPFKWSLWLILGGIFSAATIIIIILERNETNQFRFNPFLVYKIDVMENFASSATGWMVILTSFLFILVVQVYTANLTSILTQSKMKEPSFKDENETKSSNLSVGYQAGSWVEGFLVSQLKLNSSQLKALGSREKYNESLSTGTKHGGVDAIFDETPYLTLFLSKYRSHFMMTGPNYKTGGFAFAFPKGSILASHFSNAILNVTQDVEPYRELMAKNSLPTSIEDFEFEEQSDIETSSLSIANFESLYPVLISLVALSLGLATLNPSVITRLLEKLSRKSAKA